VAGPGTGSERPARPRARRAPCLHLRGRADSLGSEGYQQGASMRAAGRPEKVTRAAGVLRRRGRLVPGAAPLATWMTPDPGPAGTSSSSRKGRRTLVG